MLTKKRDELIQSPHFLREETRTDDKQLTPVLQVIQYTKELRQLEKEITELENKQEKAVKKTGPVEKIKSQLRKKKKTKNLKKWRLKRKTSFKKKVV
ncbi:hypothetical protein FQS93_15480 [Enterococcus faecalis]|nr:hypothetical protein [Enterococcus faecalis]